MDKAKVLTLIVLGFVFLSENTGISHEKDYLVKVIYFKTKSAEDIDRNKYDSIFSEIQNFFRDEMAKHGYERKTIQYERDSNNRVRVHTVVGKHSGSYYAGEVFTSFQNKLGNEIPNSINSKTSWKAQEHHYIIILAGVPIVNDGLGSPDGGAWTYSQATRGGTSVVNSNYEKVNPNHYKSLIIHELAHTFGLSHTHLTDELMGPLPYEFPKYMTENNAAKLDRHRAFSIVPIIEKSNASDLNADVNNDGYVDLYDVMIVKSGMSGETSYDTDINKDGITDENDLAIVKLKAMEAIIAAAPRKRRIQLTTWGKLKARHK